MGIFKRKLQKTVTKEERIRRLECQLRKTIKLYGNPHEDARKLEAALTDSKNLHEVRRVYELACSSFHTRGLKNLHNLAITMFGKWGSVTEARAVFDSMAHPNTDTFNCMFQAYANNGYLEEAKEIFLGLRNVSPGWWCQLIGAYARFGHVQQVKEIYDWMPEKTSVARTMLLVAYARNGYITEARKLLKSMRYPSTVAKNALLTAYAQAGLVEKAKKLFDSMEGRTSGSWNCMSQAYAVNGDLVEFRRVFDLMPMTSIASWTAMIVAYGRNGLVEEAKRIFATMPGRSVSSYNALLAAFAHNGKLQQASNLFNAMMHLRDRVSWITMIEACSCKGHGKEALWIFHSMNLYGLEPDQSICSAVLSAYRTLRRVKQAREFLLAMVVDYGLNPGVEHYCCIAQLLQLSGKRLGATEELLDTMPFIAPVSAWKSFFDACRIHKQVERAARAVEEIVKVKEEDERSLYLELAGMYFHAGKVDEVVRLLNEKGLYTGNVDILNHVVKYS